MCVQELSALKAEQEDALREARAALESANATALQGLRERQRRTLEGQMAELANQAAHQSEEEFGDAVAELEREMEGDRHSMMTSLRSAARQQQQEALLALRQQYELDTGALTHTHTHNGACCGAVCECVRVCSD